MPTCTISEAAHSAMLVEKLNYLPEPAEPAPAPKPAEAPEAPAQSNVAEK